MSQAEGPAPMTAEWWDLRKQASSQIADCQRRAGVKWTAEQRLQSKRNEYFALHGREAGPDELYANTSHWSDR